MVESSLGISFNHRPPFLKFPTVRTTPFNMTNRDDIFSYRRLLDKVFEGEQITRLSELMSPEELEGVCGDQDKALSVLLGFSEIMENQNLKSYEKSIELVVVAAQFHLASTFDDAFKIVANIRNVKDATVKSHWRVYSSSEDKDCVKDFYSNKRPEPKATMMPQIQEALAEELNNALLKGEDITLHQAAYRCHEKLGYTYPGSIYNALECHFTSKTTPAQWFDEQKQRLLKEQETSQDHGVG